MMPRPAIAGAISTPEAAQDHQPGDDDDEELEQVRAERVEGVHPPPEFDFAELAGSALACLPVEERLEQAVHEAAGVAERNGRDHDDEEDLQHEREPVGQDELAQVGHWRRLIARA